LVRDIATWYAWVAVSPLAGGAVVEVGVVVVVVFGVVVVEVFGVVVVCVEPVPFDPPLEPEEALGVTEDPVPEPDEPPAALALVDAPEVEAVERAFTCWVNGSRWRPESRALLGT
jgi:hypothetical protein